MKTCKTTIELKFDMEEIDACIEQVYWCHEDYFAVKFWEVGVADGIWKYIAESIDEKYGDYHDTMKPMLKPIFEEILQEVKSQKDYKTKYKKMLKKVLDYFE